MLLPTFEGDLVLAQDEPFVLFSGGTFQPINLHYAIYGALNERRDNAILVCHALSGSARVGDWWPKLFGPEEEDGIFDLARDCVIGINVIGSCYGSTGPRDVNPETGRAFGADFPLVNVRDWIRLHAALLDHVGVEKLRAVVGGSIGGMQAIQWAIDYPERAACCIAVGAAPLSAMGLALNHLQRLAIVNDADQPPRAGLALARAIAMCSYKSPELFDQRFGRKPNRNGEDPLRSFRERYDIGGYLDHQGEIFTRRFDADAYLIITKAMDNFDPALGYPSLSAALSRIRARVLLVGISSDWLFPPEDVKTLSRRMSEAGVDVEYAELKSAHGHDGFLAEPDALALVMKKLLMNF